MNYKEMPAQTKLYVNKGRSWWVYSSKFVKCRFLSTVQTFWKAMSVTPLPHTQHFHFNYSTSHEICFCEIQYHY